MDTSTVNSPPYHALFIAARLAVPPPAKQRWGTPEKWSPDLRATFQYVSGEEKEKQKKISAGVITIIMKMTRMKADKRQ